MPHRNSPALQRERLYIEWLIRERGYTMQEAIAYATRGQSGLLAVRSAPRAKTPEEVLVARENDLGAETRRWRRIWAPCPFRGCILPSNHSGRHKVVQGLDDPFAP